MAQHLPPLVQFPALSVRQSIPPELWEICLDSWKSLLRAYVALPDDALASHISADDSSPASFLRTYAHELAVQKDGARDVAAAKAVSLREDVRSLTARVLRSSKQPPEGLQDWRFLAELCVVGSQDGEPARTMLVDAWSLQRPAFERSLRASMDQIASRLDAGKQGVPDWDALQDLAHLIRVVSEAGRSFMMGSDLIDALAACYSVLDERMKAVVVVLVYLGFSALLHSAEASSAVDVLYGLKAAAQTGKAAAERQKAFLQDLVSRTSLLPNLRRTVGASPESRAAKLLADLEGFHDRRRTRPRKRRLHESAKGKAPLSGAGDDAHVYNMSMVSQIQDLFPDLGSAFVVKLLDAYHGDVELATTHLLEDDLTPALQAMDRTTEMPDTSQSRDLAPRSPKLSRRNVFDDDEFDNLTTDMSRVHVGRRDEDATVDKLLDEQGDRASKKAAILSALAAFDADDDERDDTYDVADVGGTVDSTLPGEDSEAKASASAMQSMHDEVLFRAWQTSPHTFARDATTRRSAARTALRKETGLTDEAIEGWAIMIKREPQRARRLEAKSAAFSGSQQELPSTSWSAAEDVSDSGGSEYGRGQQHGRGGRGRPGGRGRGSGRGGSVAGATSEKSTQVARDRKEAHKGSRANHNRRDQRARKVARAGFPG